MENDENLIKQALLVVTSSDQFATEEESAVLDDLTRRVYKTGSADFAERVYAVASGWRIDLWRVGSIFDFLVENSVDEGLAVMLAVEQWLRGANRHKIACALSMQYVFPFADIDEMTREFERIARIFPEFHDRCEELRRRRQHYQHPR